MDYREFPPPAHLAGLVKTRWTLSLDGDAAAWSGQQATPDGCVEIIRRTRGRSRWDGEQPRSFVVGLMTQPQAFEVSGDAAFEALRLWPWAWSSLDAIAPSKLYGRWQEWPAPDFAAIEARLAGQPELNRLGQMIVSAPTVTAIRQASGLTSRSLQRWFLRHVGLPARTYLQLLRFQSAFTALPGEPSLAGHAAAHGFADQAHMAREFRSLAGVSARIARQRGRGPFLT